jgi:DNA-binding MarR family transcriptional regulator
VLFIASNGTTVSNTEVAQALDVHLSNASRICDRLVQARLLRRRESPHDRRRVELSLTPRGEELLQSVTAHRRSVLTRILRQLHPPDRVALAAALDTFSDAGEESIERGISPV